MVQVHIYDCTDGNLVQSAPTGADLSSLLFSKYMPHLYTSLDTVVLGVLTIIPIELPMNLSVLADMLEFKGRMLLHLFKGLGWMLSLALSFLFFFLDEYSRWSNDTSNRKSSNACFCASLVLKTFASFEILVCVYLFMCVCCDHTAHTVNN